MNDRLRLSGLFSRSVKNPILTAGDWPYFVHTVFNPGATLLKDGTTLLDEKPTLLADPEFHPEELWGIEDPRITYVQELQRYAVVYTAFTRDGPGVAMALTDYVYYGAADTCVAVATASLRELLSWLEPFGRVPSS